MPSGSIPGQSGGGSTGYDPSATGRTAGQQSGSEGSNPANSGEPGWGDSGDTGEGQDSGLPSERGQQSDDVDFSENQSGGGDIFGDSPGGPSGGSAGGGQGQGSGAATSQEQVAVLDEELDGAMRQYDDMILKERAYVLGRAAERGAEGQMENVEEGELYDDVLADGDGSQNESPPGAPGEEQGVGDGGTVTTGERGAAVPGDGRRRPSEAFPPPDDIPSGNDDDVVARQIREAAMYEKDPELREKLWEEYRKYKEQIK